MLAYRHPCHPWDVGFGTPCERVLVFFSLFFVVFFLVHHALSSSSPASSHEIRRLSRVLSHCFAPFLSTFEHLPFHPNATQFFLSHSRPPVVEWKEGRKERTNERRKSIIGSDSCHGNLHLTLRGWIVPYRCDEGRAAVCKPCEEENLNSAVWERVLRILGQAPARANHGTSPRHGRCGIQ